MEKRPLSRWRVAGTSYHAFDFKFIGHKRKSVSNFQKSIEFQENFATGAEVGVMHYGLEQAEVGVMHYGLEQPDTAISNHSLSYELASERMSDRAHK